MASRMEIKKHILVISQYFYPEQFRINDICSEWIIRGYRVTVITGIPNYPEGRFYNGYGLFKHRRETWQGIEIIRLPLFPRGHNAIMLGMNYLSFVLSGFIWNVLTKLNADYVFIFEVSPMTQALPGVWYAKKNNIPCYLYVQDLWPDNVEIVTGIHNAHILGIIQAMVDYIYKRCDKIFATSPSFVKTIIRRGVDKKKVEYWPQYAEDFYQPVKDKDRRDQGKHFFDIIFTGNIGKAQGLDILPKVAALLKDEAVRFIIVGNGRYINEFIQEIENHNVQSMFRILGRKEPVEIPTLLGQCDAAFISFMNNPLFEKTIPAKLQSYMACGMPIIAAASGETKRIIEEAQCGICSAIGEAEELARAIKMMIDMPSLEQMEKNSLNYYNRKFSKKELLNRMDQYFRR